ncbi:MAG: MFS transporter [Clostridiales bacterium]|jgi:GPH family glycoside/pentoside/hexuronide:cation symporter/probable glucitol transport protein GutA|nr:MFS transporter [Clostridiales bacterium]
MKLNLGTLKQKTSDVFTNVREYWSKPPKGNYISYKEMGAYSLGGFGKMLIGMLAGYIGLTATNTFVGSVIGIRPLDLQTMNIMIGVLGAFFTIIRGIMVDNTRTRWGRFRPYIALAGIPMVVLMTIFVFLPFRTMSDGEKKIWVFLFALSLTFISPLFNDTYTELRTIMSPNTAERSFLVAVSSIIASAAPTITNLFVPILVGVFGGYTMQRPYQVIFVPLGIIGLFFALFTAFGTKERIFVSKQYKPKIRTLYAMKQVYRNKYWWIRSIATWTAFLEGGITTLFSWIFIYQLQNYTLYTAVLTINGLASTVAMLTTPYIIKKIGPRNLMIFQNFLNIVFITLMSLTFNAMVFGIPIFFFVFNFISIIVYEFNIVGDPVIHAEVKDFSHYQSGRRMDFMFGTAGIIGLPITLLTGYAIPLIYESGGLTNNYDVLFDPAIRNTLFATLCIVSVIGSAINLIPYLFYDLSESRHKNVIKVLRLRNMFEDYISNSLSPRDIKATVEEVREAQALINTTPVNLDRLKNKFIAISALPDDTAEEKTLKKDALKLAKKEVRAAKRLNQDIESASLVINELHKYEKGPDAEKLAFSEWVANLGFEGIKNLDSGIVAEAKTANKGTSEEEKRYYKYRIRQAKLLLKLQKIILQKNLREMDTSELDAAYEMPETTRQEINLKLKTVKEVQKKLDTYNLAAEAYMTAQAVVKDAAAYAKYDEIAAGYDQSCLDIEELDRLDKERSDAAKKAKQEDLARIRQERKTKRSGK